MSYDPGEGSHPTVPPAGGPRGPDGTSDRSRWIILVLAVAGLVAVAALVVVGLLALGGNDDAETSATTTASVPESPTTAGAPTTGSTAPDTTAGSPTTEPATTTTAPPPPTTAPPTTSADEPPPVTADPEHCREAGANPLDPDPAAQAVFIAWTRGDRPCAQRLMNPDALEELFGRDGSTAVDVFQGCNEVTDPDPHVDCAFTYPGGATHYLMRYSPTDGWLVHDVHQVAD